MVLKLGCAGEDSRTFPSGSVSKPGAQQPFRQGGACGWITVLAKAVLGLVVLTQGQPSVWLCGATIAAVMTEER